MFIPYIPFMGKRKCKYSKFIVKVQVSIGGNAPATLIYSENKNIWLETVRELGEALLGDKTKGFFYAHLTRDKKLSIDNKAPWQEW